MLARSMRMFFFFLVASFGGALPSMGEVGVTDNEIKIGTHMALTGPAAVVGQPMHKGIKIYFDYVNDTGGVYGRKLTFLVEDDAFLPSRAKEAAKKLIYNDKVFAFLAPLQGAGILASMPDIMSNKVPVVFFMAATDELTNPPKRYVFGWAVPYRTATALQVDWAVNRLGRKRIAFLNQWGPAGEENVRGATERLKKYGLDLVIGEQLQNVEMDYSGLVAKLRAKNVDCVVITTTAQWTVPILREIERQGWKVDTVIGPGSANPELLIKLAGSAAEGAFLMMNTVPLDSDDPFMNEYRDNLRKYGRGEEPAVYNNMGYGVARMFVEALRQVGKDLTREKLVGTLESWKNYDTGWIGRISYGPDDHDGAERFVVGILKGGHVVILEKDFYPLP